MNNINSMSTFCIKFKLSSTTLVNSYLKDNVVVYLLVEVRIYFVDNSNRVKYRRV